MIGKEYVYRITFEQARGKVKRGHVLHHTCGHRWCIEPSHLEQMTMGNHLKEHGLHGDHFNSKKKVCANGHRYSKANTYLVSRRSRPPNKGPSVERQCRKCVREYKARFRRKQRPMHGKAV